ncbi:hypothetical protein [Paenibacillus sp. FSL E2-0178]|uniref:hypothetical protein n=1 Tax=Paenibacillus sp. FSL E2-0178 TaxID=2921361 RepID=UPI003158A47C
MKWKYGIFGMDKYDLGGGMNDMLLSFNTYDEADSYFNSEKSLKYDYWELVDFSTLDRHDIDSENPLVSIQQTINKIEE